jgi:hypothetical protein
MKVLVKASKSSRGRFFFDKQLIIMVSGGLLVRFFIFLSLLFVGAGCASMFGPSTDRVSLESEPSGADVYLRGTNLGKTPVTIDLPRRTEAVFLTFKKEHFETKQVHLNQTIDGVAFLNFGFTTTTSGATSWGIDLINGRAWKYAPDAYVVHLESATKSADRKEGQSIDRWNETVFDYVMANAINLKTDLARGTGPTLTGLCDSLNKSTEACAGFVRAVRDTNIANQNTFEMYQTLRKADNQG